MRIGLLRRRRAGAGGSAPVIPDTPGIAMIWRWGQSNEGTLGNNPGQLAAQYRGAFPGIQQIDNVGNTLDPTETFELIPYAILDDGDDDVVIGEDTISAPQGEYTLIGDGVAVGPTVGMATEIRDEALFDQATDIWFWKASSAGKALSYFMPEGDVASYASGQSNLSWGWRYKCYANRHLRTLLAASSDPIFVQCTGDWQGEADVTAAGGSTSSDYITQYATEHLKVYQSDADVLGVEPPYFKVALREVDSEDTDATNALNAAIEAMCRYKVDLAGAITDTGSGHSKMYFVDHGFAAPAESGDPHVSADEQRQIGEAISTALRTLHGTDGYTSAYELTSVKPQLTGVSASTSGTSMTVTGYYSDPGTITVTCTQGGETVGTGEEVITDTTAGGSFSVTVNELPAETSVNYSVSIELSTGEVSVPKTGSELTEALVRSWDETFNTSDFSYSTTNSANDTVTRLATTGARYPRGIPVSTSGKKYFEVTTDGDIAMVGVGAYSTPHHGGVTGEDRSGFVGGNIRYTGGTFSITGNISGYTYFRVAVDLDAQLMWVGRGAEPWNENGSADPATGAGGFDISGMDTENMVPLIGFSAAQDGVSAVLIAASGDWSGTAPSGFGEIGA